MERLLGIADWCAGERVGLRVGLWAGLCVGLCVRLRTSVLPVGLRAPKRSRLRISARACTRWEHFQEFYVCALARAKRAFVSAYLRVRSQLAFETACAPGCAYVCMIVRLNKSSPNNETNF
eukprot:1331743-Pleurochrysis_carterae.AAC.1